MESAILQIIQENLQVIVDTYSGVNAHTDEINSALIAVSTAAQDARLAIGDFLSSPKKSA